MDEWYDGPYSIEPNELGTCPFCGSGLENWGEFSDGDGDLYEEIGCPLCEESIRQDNVRYYHDEGYMYPLEEEMWEFGNFENGVETLHFRDEDLNDISF